MKLNAMESAEFTLPRSFRATVGGTRDVNRAGPGSGRIFFGPGRAEKILNLLAIRAGFSII